MWRGVEFAHSLTSGPVGIGQDSRPNEFILAIRLNNPQIKPIIHSRLERIAREMMVCGPSLPFTYAYPGLRPSN